MPSPQQHYESNKRKARRKTLRKLEDYDVEEEYCYRCSEFHKFGFHTI